MIQEIFLTLYFRMTKDIPHVKWNDVPTCRIPSDCTYYWFWLYTFLINLLINLTAPCYQWISSVPKQITDDILIMRVQYILKEEDVQTVFSDFLNTVLILYIKCCFLRNFAKYQWPLNVYVSGKRNEFNTVQLYIFLWSFSISIALISCS